MFQFSLNREFEELVKATLTEEQVLSNDNSDNTDNKITVEDESAKSPDFFQDNNAIKRGNAGNQIHDYTNKV